MENLNPSDLTLWKLASHLNCPAGLSMRAVLYRGAQTEAIDIDAAGAEDALLDALASAVEARGYSVETADASVRIVGRDEPIVVCGPTLGHSAASALLDTLRAPAGDPWAVPDEPNAPPSKAPAWTPRPAKASKAKAR